LADVLVPHPLGVRDAEGEQARARDDHLRQSTEAVAADRVRDQAVRLWRMDVDDDRVHERAGEAEPRGERAEVAAVLPRDQHRAQQREAHRAEQHQLRREREPVDVGSRNHFAASNCMFTSVRARSLVNERSVIAAGQTDSASRHASSGTIAPSSAGRRSSASAETAGPGSRCSTAEISRSMYIAAKTIATAPTTE